MIPLMSPEPLLETSQGSLPEDNLADLIDELSKRADRRGREHPTESREANLAAVAKEMIAEGELAGGARRNMG
jgi:hypothetical protein